MRTITVALGGREFTVRQLPVGPMARWAAEHEEVSKPIGELAMAMGVQNPTPAAMARLALSSGLLIDTGRLLEAAISYAPELMAERAWIEENCYTDELFAAVTAFFFGAAPPKPKPETANGEAPLPGKTTSTS